MRAGGVTTDRKESVAIRIRGFYSDKFEFGRFRSGCFFVEVNQRLNGRGDVRIDPGDLIERV